MTAFQTFTFEGHYRDKDGGNRCDVVQAYSRDQALALAAISMIDDNEWADDPERYNHCSNMAAVYTDEVHIDSEWTDLKGTACPNCTSHGGRENGNHIDIDGATREVMECKACGYEWVPLGMKARPDRPTSEQIDAEIAARWLQLLGEGDDWSCDRCGETAQDGSGVCITCGEAA